MCVQLSRAVQAWEPRSEQVALHAWLHPWLELLGPQLEDLYPTIRFKLATALQAWHASDASALALLSPWHTVHSLALIPLSPEENVYLCECMLCPRKCRYNLTPREAITHLLGGIW